MTDQALVSIRSLLRSRSAIRHRLGPVFYADNDEASLEVSARDLVESVVRGVETVAASPRMHLRAPSAWHAALFLQTLHIGSVVGADETSLASVSGPLLFRGMADASWNIVSSLQRAKGDPRAAAKASAFARLMARTAAPIVHGVDLGDEVWIPVAQHYGLATDLVDFTPDSDVAVSFASLGAGHLTGVVYFTSVAETLASNMAVLLPPPLFRRIQLQRGVFLRSNGELSKDLFHRIEFPTVHGFQLARNGDYPGLLPEPEWVQLAREFIKHLPEADLALPGSDLEAKWWDSDRIALMRRPPTFNPDREFAQWIDFFEEMRYWLAGVFAGDTEAFREDLLSVLRTQNRALYDIHKDFMRALGKPY